MKFPNDADFTSDFDGSHARAREIFSLVENPDDWKGPISAWVNHEELGAVILAIEFFTATSPRVVSCLGSKFLVESEGYRAGPAGP